MKKVESLDNFKDDLLHKINSMGVMYIHKGDLYHYLMGDTLILNKYFGDFDISEVQKVYTV